MLKNIYIYIFIFDFLFFHNISQAQKLSFSDTYPVNNIDSVKYWLLTNPKPSEERLKNLIRLERTYFKYCEQGNKELAEIKELADTLKNPIGQASYHWLIANQKSSEWVLSDFKHAIQAYEIFKTAKDTSGLITVLGLLAFINNESGAESFDSNHTAKEYIAYAEKLLKARFNHHDNIQLFRFKVYQNIKYLKSDPTLVNRVQEFVDFYEHQPLYAYAILRLRIQLAILYYYAADYKRSYLTNKETLSRLRSTQTEELIFILGNLTNDCLRLNRHTERLEYAKAGFNLLDKSTVELFRSKLLIFTSLKEEFFRIKRYKEAAIYTDSLLNGTERMNQTQRDIKILIMQEHYQNAEKRKQIADLLCQQEETKKINRFILFIYIITLLVLIILGLLWTKLRRTNQQLLIANEQLKTLTSAREQFFAIIAHDLRRPFHAYQGMSEMINYYLKKGDYSAIGKISQAIDDSGLHIRQLLDNLLKWALTQKEEVPYKPELLNLRTQIQSVIGIYQTVFINRNIEFEVVCDDSLSVFVDRNAFELILRNLINNGLSAITGKLGVIKIQATPQSNGHIKLLVCDNGDGFDAAKISAFRQVLANPNIGEVGQNGFGFGLVLIAKFAKRNGITVDFESRVGEGTCFELLLATIEFK